MKKTAVIFIIALALCMLFSAQALFAGGQAEEGETSAPAATGVGANFAPTGIALGGSIYTNFNYYNSTGNMYLTLGVYPSVGFFVVQNLQLNITPYVNYQTDFEGSNSTTVGAGVGMQRYFYSGKSVVPALGVNLNPYFTIGSAGGINFNTEFNTYFFVTDQIAPYVGVRVGVDFYDFDVDLLRVYARAGLGVVYFIPEAVGPRS